MESRPRNVIIITYQPRGQGRRRQAACLPETSWPTSMNTLQRTSVNNALRLLRRAYAAPSSYSSTPPTLRTLTASSCIVVTARLSRPYGSRFRVVELLKKELRQTTVPQKRSLKRTSSSVHPHRSSAGIPPRSEGNGELTLTPLRGVTALRSNSPGRSRNSSPLREPPALRSPPLLL